MAYLSTALCSDAQHDRGISCVPETALSSETIEDALFAEPATRFIHNPNAHMATQGSTLSSNGATPAATSQLQLNAKPRPSTSVPSRTSPRRPRSQEGSLTVNGWDRARG
ncbi:hypothetical protein A4U53_005170 (plasmid) [Rhizobium ruizarguesonis]|uniref:Uncharacterized protein n=1 Tax=Rhizobium ruizarguesonis TaxID=2081791 RepID=A0ACD5EH13_9HYPH